MTGFRTATLDDVHQMLDWAAHEGWNPGLDDAAAFFAADPAGFFVAVEGNAPVACISVVNHTDAFAFLGLYIAHPEIRGKGIGYGLWQHAIDHAGTRTIGLDGVPEQQSNYAASGFRNAGSTTRFAGSVSVEETRAARLAEVGDIPDLIAREAAASGVRKDAYLTAWFTNTSNRQTMISADGFCTVRRCRAGAKIGPLVADTVEGAKDLMQQAAAVFGPDLIIDVPTSAPDLNTLCHSLGMTPGFETARMYRGTPPVSGDTSFFAVTSLELG